VTDRIRLDDMTDDQLDQMYAQLERHRHLRAVAGIHCQALGTLLRDAGIRMPDNAMHLYLLLVDELTLTLEALAEQRPASLGLPALRTAASPDAAGAATEATEPPTRHCVLAARGRFQCLPSEPCATCDKEQP